MRLRAAAGGAVIGLVLWFQPLAVGGGDVLVPKNPDGAGGSASPARAEAISARHAST